MSQTIITKFLKRKLVVNKDTLKPRMKQRMLAAAVNYQNT